MADTHTDPFRLRVLKALTAALETITPANGYRYDMSPFTENGIEKKRVFRGRSGFGHNDPRPMLSILEDPTATERLLTSDVDSQTRDGFYLLIGGFLEDDPDNPTDPAHVLSAEVIKCLAQEAKRSLPGSHLPNNILGLGDVAPCFNPNGKGLLIGSAIVRPEDEEVSDVAYFYLKIRCDLIEDLTRPFD